MQVLINYVQGVSSARSASNGWHGTPVLCPLESLKIGPILVVCLSALPLFFRSAASRLECASCAAAWLPAVVILVNVVVLGIVAGLCCFIADSWRGMALPPGACGRHSLCWSRRSGTCQDILIDPCTSWLHGHARGSRLNTDSCLPPAVCCSVVH